MAHRLTDITTPQSKSPPVHCMSRDIEIAMALATHAPNGEAASRVRERLRGYIALLAAPAESQVRRMEQSRERDVATGTVRHARSLAGSGGDPAATLRLLAKSVQQLLRYAADEIPAQLTEGGGAGAAGLLCPLSPGPPLPSPEQEGIAHPYGRGQPVRAHREETVMEQSKSEHALQSGPVVEAPDGADSIVAPSSVVRIEDVEDEGP
ncbi:DUF6415 family natural product biosynthesis protein [Streptomyces noboritoensis]|uniref:DUF6415 family natural product biosynthesis protein n=1 Tax=Streptomyces noboritoensis TaxID=67337 RepID=A0ABV6TDR2_9ACTN